MATHKVDRPQYTAIFATNDEVPTTRTLPFTSVTRYYCCTEVVGNRWYDSSRCCLLLSITLICTTLFLVIMGSGYPIGLLAQLVRGGPVRYDVTSAYLAASDGMGVLVMSIFVVVGIALLIIKCTECCRACCRCYRSYRDELTVVLPAEYV